MTTREMDYAITYIAVKNLSIIWAKSQRPFSESHAKNIADNFDPDKFEPVIVTKPNGAGIYHIVEGQHRKAAAEIALGANQQLPCHVIDHADPARAAEIWLGINDGRKAVRPVVKFLVSVEAKREAEIKINTIVKRCGYYVGDNAAARDNCISAIAALRKVFNYGDKTLTHALEACRLLWGSDPGGVRSPMIGGLGIFMNEFHDHVDPKRLRSTIQAKYKSPWKLIDAAKARKEKASEALDFSLAEVVRMTYNTGLREDKRLRRKQI